MKTGTRNVVAEKKAVETIETLLDQFKRKRINKDDFIRRINQSLSSMSDERDYIQYLLNIGQY